MGNTTLSGWFVQPIRYDSASPVNRLFYNSTTKEVVYNNTAGASDERLKTNIVSADVGLCYSTIQNLPLKYFAWKEEFLLQTGMTDKHELGWTAQDVKPFFPKSVHITSNVFFSDFHSLQTDQIYQSHIGATKHLIQTLCDLASEIKMLKQQLHMK